MSRFLLKAYYVLTVPVAIYFILDSRRIHPAYKLNFFKKYRLGFKMFLNKLRVETGTSYKSHLAMALKIFETPPDVEGAIVECGTWKGGSAANLSLVCRMTGRKLLIYDSFEGLPEKVEGDREAGGYETGDYCGTLEEVRENIRRYGAIEVCEFVQGWFNDTLPQLKQPVLLAFLDVDYEASLETCVRYIWNNLTEKGYIFIDEYVGLDYCSIFYSETYWKRFFNRTPPGLVGAGVGLPLGEYYVGPFDEIGEHPSQHPNAGAYTRKDFSGYWSFYPPEEITEK
ncbi:MAG: TylF/MycF family methyltransferase [Acidobacteriota bacterium]|nr:TylF/MycF family methyltransferase [Acidobacteriota bacterium]